MHLYLHIPFCHEICPYCSFYKHKPGNVSQGEFIDALIKELDWNAGLHDLSQVSTIYLGGGTPSLLSNTHLKRLFKALSDRLSFSNLSEITLEANPSTFDQKKATLIKELGVTRVSLGVQSFDPEQLKVLGRDHTREEAVESYHLLRNAELPAVNIDLMFSTPGQTIESWKETLETAITLKPDHISAYNLTYEEDTAYFQKFLTGEYTDEEDKNESLFTLADTLLGNAGYEHYETSNYALNKNSRSLHNQGYWTGKPYLGLGPSAVSCLERKRHKNLSDTAGYIKRIQSFGNAIDEHEILDDEAWRLERLALELRTKKGVSIDYVEPALLRTLEEKNLLIKSGKRVKTTSKGACLVDSIVEYLA